jgi:hypothetical protein
MYHGWPGKLPNAKAAKERSVLFCPCAIYFEHLRTILTSTKHHGVLKNANTVWPLLFLRNEYDFLPLAFDSRMHLGKSQVHIFAIVKILRDGHPTWESVQWSYKSLPIISKMDKNGLMTIPLRLAKYTHVLICFDHGTCDHFR